MAEAKTAAEGNTVKVHYKGTLSDGSVFDSSEGKEPIAFKIGEHHVIKGFEDAMTGMKVGEKKRITLKSTEAYGDPDPKMVQEVPMEALTKAGITPEVGMVLGLQHPAQPGMQMPAKVVEIGKETVKLDLNHPLAGKELTFELELAGIE